MSNRYTVEDAINNECILDNNTGYLFNTRDFLDNLCDLLNKYEEENISLKEQINSTGGDYDLLNSILNVLDYNSFGERIQNYGFEEALSEVHELITEVVINE